MRPKLLPGLSIPTTRILGPKTGGAEQLSTNMLEALEEVRHQ